MKTKLKIQTCLQSRQWSDFPGYDNVAMSWGWMITDSRNRSCTQRQTLEKEAEVAQKRISEAVYKKISKISEYGKNVPEQTLQQWPQTDPVGRQRSTQGPLCTNSPGKIKEQKILKKRKTGKILLNWASSKYIFLFCYCCLFIFRIHKLCLLLIVADCLRGWW